MKEKTSLTTSNALTESAPRPREERRPQKCRHVIKDTTKPNSEPAIEVFDFEKNWRLVLAHLDHPDVEDAWMEWFDCSVGPWAATSCDFWWDQISARASEALSRGEIEYKCEKGREPTEEQLEEWKRSQRQFWPKVDTLEWFQCFHGGHYLAPFLRELGERIFPELTWDIMTGDAHSLAYGTDETGNIKVLFDILNFKEMSAMELIELATPKDPDPEAEEKLLAE
jgi:hypothetical protein